MTATVGPLLVSVFDREHPVRDTFLERLVGVVRLTQRVTVCVRLGVMDRGLRVTKLLARRV